MSRSPAILALALLVGTPGSPQDPSALAEYIDGREKFALALREADLKGATTLWKRCWQKVAAGFSDGDIRSAVSSGPALDVALLDRVETWLARRAESDEVQLRVMFDLRDLVAVALARAEIDAALERLAKDKVEVTVPVDGAPRKGVLRRERGGALNLYETVDAGGQKGEVGHAVSLGVRDFVRLWRVDRERRKVTADHRTLLGEALLAHYDGQPEAPAAIRAAELAAPGTERARVRAADYLRILGGERWPAKLLGRATEAQAWFRRGRALARSAPGESATAFGKSAKAYAALVEDVERERPGDNETADNRDAWARWRRHRALADALSLGALVARAEATFRVDAPAAVKLLEAAERAMDEALLKHSDRALCADLQVRMGEAWRARAEADAAQRDDAFRRALELFTRAQAALQGDKSEAAQQAVLHATVAEASARAALHARGTHGNKLIIRAAVAGLQASPAARDSEAGFVLRLLEAEARLRNWESAGVKLLEEIVGAPGPSWAVDAAFHMLARYARLDCKLVLANADGMLNRGGDGPYRAIAVCRSAMPHATEAERASLWHLMGSGYYLLCRWHEAAIAFAQSKHPDAAAASVLALERIRKIDPASAPGLDEARRKVDAARLSALENAFDGRRARWAAGAQEPRTLDEAVAAMEWPAVVGAPAPDSRPRVSVPEEIGDAILSALKWLSRHQQPEGSWGVEAYTDRCNRVARYSSAGKCQPTAGHPAYEVGVTGLALLAFLRAGHGPGSLEAHDGVCFGDTVRRGLLWLMKQQDREGAIGRKDRQQNEPYMYDHLLAGAALAEAAARTASPALQEAAQKAVDFTVAAQNLGSGWGYSMRSGESTTAVTGWAALQIEAAERSGLGFPRTCWDGTRAWLNAVQDDNEGWTGYRKRAREKSFFPGKNENYNDKETLTAIAVFARITMDRNKADSRLPAGRNLILKDLPNWKGNDIDYCYWFFGTLAMMAFDGPLGPSWKEWSARAKDAIVKNQNTHSTGCKSGSWETVDRWSCAGGRVYGTAINALTLTVFGSKR